MQLYMEHADAVEMSTEEFLASQGIFVNTVSENGELISGVCDEIVGDFDAAISSVRKMTDFEWSLPKPAVPKFDIAGEFSFQPPRVPKVSVTWNAKGAILTGATIFGALGDSLLGGGEAGHEALLPLDSFYRNLEDILTRRYAGNSQLIVNFEIEHFENHTEQDIDDLVDAVSYKLFIQAQKEAASI